MGRGVVAAVKRLLVRLLRAVVRERLAGNLAPGQSAAIRESCEEDRVDRALLHKNVQHVVDAFIHERHGADLNSDHPVGCRRFGAANRGRKQRRADRAGRGDTGGGLEEFPTRDAGRRFRFHRLSGLQQFHAVSAATISYSRM